jgi:hypothetical protein
MRRLLLLILIALGSCQPLPHPFAEDHPPPFSPILSPPDSVGILVGPVAGAPPESGTVLAEEMAEALRSQDVPANTKIGNRKSYRLRASAESQEEAGQRTRVTVNWQLYGADGHLIGNETASGEAADAQWRTGDKATADALVRNAAPALASRVEGDVPVEASIADPILEVRGVSGAPGDGERSLTRNIGDALRHAGIAIKDKPQTNENFLLDAKVEVAAPANGKQNVKITWQLMRADGGPIGQVKQENAVPAGTLNGPWGDVAYAVAINAASGIVALVQRARQAETTLGAKAPAP